MRLIAANQAAHVPCERLLAMILPIAAPRHLGLRRVRDMYTMEADTSEGGRSIHGALRSGSCQRFDVKTTCRFDEQVRRKRPYVDPAWRSEVLGAPLRREEQPDGRFRWSGAVTAPRFLTRRYAGGWRNRPQVNSLIADLEEQ